jgi:P-loop containing NTP hydrolase pore-1/C-terminal domain on Strawberry notch homologue
MNQMTRHDPRAAEEPEALRLVEHPPITCSFQGAVEEIISADNLLTPSQTQSALLALQALARPPRAFFLGHGPGVGKTRILASIAKQHLATHSAPDILWLVPNSALKKQAENETALFGIPKGAFRLASYAQIRLASMPARGSLLILDEAHLIRNVCPTSDRVNSLQDSFEAVVYSTATAASNVARLSYMKRLRLWGEGSSFENFQEFSKAMKRWGPAASEMLALDLKQRGLYTCFRLPLIPLKTLDISPNAEARGVFDEACEAWKGRASPDKFSFLQRLTTSLKAQILVPRWKDDLKEGYSVVIVLQGTGAAASERGVSMLERICRRNGVKPPCELPRDALEVIREGLHPEGMAEISGRPVSMRQTKFSAREEEDVSLVRGNSKELSAFREGRRRILAMTAAGTLGLNITSPWPIRMYVLEFPWTPESLAQQLGRCNRLDSRAPDYFMVSLKSIIEKRVEASLSARSETLGALSCADRTAGAIKTLPWGRKLMKLVTLEMTTRLLAESLPKDVVRGLVSAASEAPRLIRRDAGLNRLQHEELLRGNEEERRQGLRSILASDPSVAGWMSGGWTTATHPLFPETQQNEVMTTLPCLLRHGLPTPLARHILEYAFGSDWAVARCLEGIPEGTRFLDEKEASVLLNSGSTLDLESQRRLLQSCEENSARMTVREPRIMSVLEYCYGRKTSPRGFYFEVAVLPCSEEEKIVFVASRSTVEPVKEPLLFTTSSGHLVHLDCGMVQYPGRPSSAVADDQSAKLRKWIPLDALGRFRCFEAKNLRLRAKAAGRMSKSLRLRVRNPLQHWEFSAGQVISVPETTTHDRFVGLLMDTTELREEGSLQELHAREEARLL